MKQIWAGFEKEAAQEISMNGLSSKAERAR